MGSWCSWGVGGRSTIGKSGSPLSRELDLRETCPPHKIRDIHTHTHTHNSFFNKSYICTVGEQQERTEVKFICGDIHIPASSIPATPSVELHTKALNEALT